jgi:hypothetical protein
MSPERQLEILRRQHGVPPERAQRLLPLVQRALDAQGILRARLLDVVSAALRADAAELATELASRATAQLDDTCLRSVGRLLHDWPHRREA